MKWEEMEEEFKLIKSTKNNPKTIKSYEKAFRKFKVYWEETHPGAPLPDPKEFTMKDMAMYTLWLKSKYQANYVEKLYSNLLQFFEFCGNPDVYRMKELRPKREKKPRVYYSLKEVRELLDLYDESSFTNLMLKTLIHIIALTGMRAFEAENLKWSQVDLRENYFTLKGKGGKWRKVIIPQPLRELLTRYKKAWDGYKSFAEAMGWSIPGGDSLFFRIDENGRPWPGTDRVFYNRIRRKAGKIGIHFNFKKFRATLIKLIHELNQPSEIAALIAGHSDIKTTIDFYHELEIEVARPIAEEVVNLILGRDNDEGRTSSHE
ncbi:MAG: site-specific integrase [Thermoplasmata archaeon]|nr:site-specific integrase [Thermoplasmata archaeon]